MSGRTMVSPTSRCPAMASTRSSSSIAVPCGTSRSTAGRAALISPAGAQQQADVAAAKRKGVAEHGAMLTRGEPFARFDQADRGDLGVELAVEAVRWQPV